MSETTLPACPVETTLTLIRDKWTILILRDLLGGTKRFWRAQTLDRERVAEGADRAPPRDGDERARRTGPSTLRCRLASSTRSPRLG